MWRNQKLIFNFMKKLFLSIAVLAAGTASYAQIGQGSILLGGSLAFSSTGEQTNKTVAGGVTTETKTPGFSNWNFSPRVGYFLSDNLAVGLDLGLGQSHVKTVTNGTAEEKVSSFNLDLGLFARYYMNISDNFYFFGQARVGYRSSSYQDRMPDPANANTLIDGPEVTSNTFGIGITPGLTYFPSPKWGVDFTLGGIIDFSSTTSKSEMPNNGGSAESSGSQFGLGFGLNPGLGLHYYMGR